VELWDGDTAFNQIPSICSILEQFYFVFGILFI
jgi:hypothetical protein